jgi:hypothetical protein
VKVTRFDNRVRISCSEHEFEILSIMADNLSAEDPTQFLPSSGLRRSWARRTSGGVFLRIDNDKRTR